MLLFVLRVFPLFADVYTAIASPSVDANLQFIITRNRIVTPLPPGVYSGSTVYIGIVLFTERSLLRGL